MQQQRHICFYSNKDPWSKAFIEALKETPWIREFRFVCADEPRNRPKWLKQVPTLIIDGDIQNPLIDSDVMNWLYEKKLREGPKHDQKQSSGTVPSMPSEPMSWNTNEMGGFGDAGYSYLDSDTTTQGNGGSTIPGNFTFLNGGSSPGDRQSQQAISGTSQSTGKTKKEQQFDAQMEMYMRNRDSGMPQVRRPL